MAMQTTRLRLLLILCATALISVLGLGVSLREERSYAASHQQTIPPAALYLPLVNLQAEATDVATSVYIVQPGDTLFSIARRFGTTVDVLVQLNHLSNPNLITPGQELLVPATAAPPTATPTATPADPTPTPTATPADPTPIPSSIWSAPANPIELFSPVGAGLYHSPIEVIGFSQTFESVVNLRLAADDGTILAERNASGGSADGFDFFHTYLRFTATEPITATLAVFEISAEDGSEIHKVTLPLRLLPGQRVI